MKKVVSTLMLLFFLVGQINLTMASHFCGDNLVDASISITPEKSHCCGDESSEKAANSCCEDEYTTVETDEAFGKTEIDFTALPELIIAYSYILMGLDLIQDHDEKTFPPLINSPNPDLQALYQNYLI